MGTACYKAYHSNLDFNYQRSMLHLRNLTGSFEEIETLICQMLKKFKGVFTAGLQMFIELTPEFLDAAARIIAMKHAEVRLFSYM